MLWPPRILLVSFYFCVFVVETLSSIRVIGGPAEAFDWVVFLSVAHEGTQKRGAWLGSRSVLEEPPRLEWLCFVEINIYVEDAIGQPCVESSSLRPHEKDDDIKKKTSHLRRDPIFLLGREDL